MRGSLNVIEMTKAQPPSAGLWQDTIIYCEDTVFANCLERLPDTLVIDLYKQASENLAEAIEENRTEGDPVPSGAALQRAEEEMSAMALLYAASATSHRHPLVTATVTRGGEVEIVGCYQGVLGRLTVIIDQDGTCARMHTTRWLTR